VVLISVVLKNRFRLRRLWSGWL